MSNWLWLALGVGALALFVFGRAGCGMGHGGHAHRSRDEGNQDRQGEVTTRPAVTSVDGDQSRSVASPNGHLHGVPPVAEGALAAEHAGHGGSTQSTEPRRHRHGC